MTLPNRSPISPKSEAAKRCHDFDTDSAAGGRPGLERSRNPGTVPGLFVVFLDVVIDYVHQNPSDAGWWNRPEGGSGQSLAGMKIGL